jgi:hypothetical protein
MQRLFLLKALKTNMEAIDIDHDQPAPALRALEAGVAIDLSFAMPRKKAAWRRRWVSVHASFY